MVRTKRDHVCETCGRVFHRSDVLKDHVRIYTGEKPFKCNICGRRFTQRSSCRAHVMTHNKEKPYECPNCGNNYSQKSGLVRHMRKCEPVHIDKKEVDREYTPEESINDPGTFTRIDHTGRKWTMRKINPVMLESSRISPRTQAEMFTMSSCWLSRALNNR